MKDLQLTSIVRAGIYLSMLAIGLTLYFSGREFIDFRSLVAVAGVASIGLAVQLSLIFGPSLWERHSELLYLVAWLDIILISIGFFFTGGSQVLFVIFYLVIVFSSGFVFGFRASLVTAILASLGYLWALILGSELTGLNLVSSGLLNVFSLFAMSFVSGYIHGELNWLSSELSLKDLSQRVLQRLHLLIVQYSPIGILTVKEDGGIVTANPPALKIVRSAHQIQDIFPGLNFRKTTHLETPGPHGRKIQVTTLPMSDPDFVESTYLCLLQDVTEIRELDRRARESEKLAAVGRLAAGIAHEIRNPLTGISGAVQYLRELKPSVDEDRLLKIAEREVDRLNGLVSEFLEFARPMDLELTDISLSDLVEKTLEAFHLGQPEIRIESRIEQGIHVLGHADKLRQPLLNLFLNAAQALSLKGSEGLIQIALQRSSEDFAELTVSDNGIGIPKENLEKIFEPFFTTKPKGTGLGLAISMKILEQHKVQTKVHSEIGSGTSFVLRFHVAKAT